MRLERRPPGTLLGQSVTFFEFDEVPEQRALMTGRAACVPLCAGVANQAPQMLPVGIRAMFEDVPERDVAFVEQARAPTFRTMQ